MASAKLFAVMHVALINEDLLPGTTVYKDWAG
jgi:hypothetical protein